MAPKQALWSETTAYVQKSFTLNKALYNTVPSKMVFTEDDKKLIFLAGVGRSMLYTVDLDTDEQDTNSLSQYKPLFDPKGCSISRKEELLRERQRISKTGVATYEYSNKTLLVPLGFNMYYHNISSEENDPMIITEKSEMMFFDTKLCPTDPRLISFIGNNDLFVTAGHYQEYLRLTSTPNPQEIYNGVPSFIVQEEFDRYTGYYWRPTQPQEDVYHILYEEVDESAVPTVRLTALQDDGDTGYKFPLAGGVNPHSSLKLVQFTFGLQNGSPCVMQYDLKRELHVTFPWLEYIPWFNWFPDGNSIWAMLLDRRQQQMSIVHVPLTYFTDRPATESDPEPDRLTVLYHRSCDTWVHVSRDIHFMVSSPHFILKSENKYSHLHLVAYSSGEDVPLTRGEWSVTKLAGVDEISRVVYFHALVSPVQQHLYKVSLDEPGSMVRISVDGYFHDCILNNSFTAFVSVYSSLHTHFQCGVFSTSDGTKLRTITKPLLFKEIFLQRIADLEPCADNEENYGELRLTKFSYDPPELSSIMVDGEEIYYMLYPAKNRDLSQPHPVVLNVYGGPEIQLVSDKFKGIAHRQQNLLASMGYSVVIADCPGSANRGKAWAERLYKKMGTVEVGMQVRVLEELSKRHVFLDLNRVAVMGTSYGGYVSLMALAQRPDFFRLAIAIAPATAWYLYDTAYSERYMGLRSENEELYQGPSSVMNYVHNLPSEENRLLLIHGLMDENVHFTHTTTLINALIDAGKPYELRVYPEERHGIGRGNALGHCETTICVFLRNHLEGN